MIKLTLLSSGFAINEVTASDAVAVTQYGARYRDANQQFNFANNAIAFMTEEVKLTIDKFDGSDWNYYKHQVEVVMKKMKIFKYLEVDEETLKIEMGSNWSEDDGQKAFATIFMSLTKAVQPKVWGIEKPYEMWKILKGRYEVQSVSNKMSLTRELLAVKQEEGQSIDDLFNVLTDKWNSLKSAGKEVTEEDKICKLLESLNGNFTHKVSVIEATMKADEKVEDVLNKLLGEEKRQVEAGVIQSHSMALNAFGKDKKTELTQSTNKNKGKRDFKCHNCGKLGHFAKECRSKKRQNHQGHAGVAFAVNPNSIGNAVTWLLDSGATFHMTMIESILTNLSPDSTTVTCAGGQILTAKSKGTVQGTINGQPVTIEEVYYFPEITANLLSVTRMSMKNVSIIFEKGNCEAKFNGKSLFKAQRSGNMFTVKLKPNQERQANSITPETLQQWHEKLGHRDIKIVKKCCKKTKLILLILNLNVNRALKGSKLKCLFQKHLKDERHLLN